MQSGAVVWISENCELTPDDRIRFRHPEGPFPSDPLAPRTAVTYQEMLDYTAWLNGKVGAVCIPDSDQSGIREYAARAGTSTEFAQGHRLGLEQANFLVVRRESVNGEYVWNYDLGSVNALVSVDRSGCGKRLGVAAYVWQCIGNDQQLRRWRASGLGDVEPVSGR